MFHIYNYYLEINFQDFLYRLTPFFLKKKLKRLNRNLIIKFLLKCYIKCTNNNKIKKDNLGFKYALLFHLILHKSPKCIVLHIKQKKIYYFLYQTLNLKKILLYFYYFEIFFKQYSILKNLIIKYDYTKKNTILYNIIENLDLLSIFYDLKIISKRERKRILIEIFLNHFFFKKFKLNLYKLNIYLLSLFNLTNFFDNVKRQYISFKKYKNIKI